MPMVLKKDADKAAKTASEKVMASAKVLYKGHAVAAVAAVSSHIAEAALELIDVRYEALPAATQRWSRPERGHGTRDRA